MNCFFIVLFVCNYYFSLEVLFFHGLFRFTFIEFYYIFKLLTMALTTLAFKNHIFAWKDLSVSMAGCIVGTLFVCVIYFPFKFPFSKLRLRPYLRILAMLLSLPHPRVLEKQLRVLEELSLSTCVHDWVSTLSIVPPFPFSV